MVVSFPEATCSLNECAQNVETGKMNESNYLTTREVAERLAFEMNNIESKQSAMVSNIRNLMAQ
jgi:hypothetical protein